MLYLFQETHGMGWTIRAKKICSWFFSIPRQDLKNILSRTVHSPECRTKKELKKNIQLQKKNMEWFIKTSCKDFSPLNKNK